MHYAHSPNALGHRQELGTHLRNVAELAAGFAADFAAAEVGRYLGLCHDVGKFVTPFQEYLLDSDNGSPANGSNPQWPNP